MDDKFVIPMRVDSASVVTVLPKSLMPCCYQLKPAPCPLQPMGAEQVKPLGTFEADLRFGDLQTRETVFVVEDSSQPVPALLGERASLQLGFLSAPISAVDVHASPEGLSSLPAMRGPISILLNPNHPPSQQSSRRLAPAMLTSLSEQLDAWLAQGVVEMVEEVAATDFVSPLVSVFKLDKTIRWCVDLRRVNEAVHRPGLQLPSTDDLLSQLAGARVFTKLDLKSGYSQLELTPESRRAFVVASPLGYFRFCRLPFGVCSGPELFQQKMEQILAGCMGVLIYLDDILIFAPSPEEHDIRLKAVMSALDHYGVTLNDKKCVYKASELTFLGHQVSGDGISPGKDKVEAISSMPDPQNVSELRSFLGLSTYLAKFLPNMANVTAPLNALLKGPWSWTSDCSAAAEKIRSHFCQEQVLSLFDPTLPTRIEVDASGCGLGAVLMQLAPGSGSEWKPVYYASRRLTGPESRYAAIEREALAVVWGAHRFRTFVTGSSFVVLTDHKPLLQLFSPTYNLSLASVRIQRLILKVQDLSFDVHYRPGKFNQLADALSRLPCEAPDVNFVQVHCVTAPDGVSAHRRMLAQSTAADSLLCQVRSALHSGKWPSSPEIAPYQALAHELSVWPFPNSNDFLILRGEKVVIPSSACQSVLDLAHEGHTGVERTRERVRDVAWWPGWTKAVKRHVANCETCLCESRARPVPLKPRELPPRPWHSIAVDVFYYQGKAFFSIMDLYSRFPVVTHLASESTDGVVRALENVFCLFGTPARLISDNGPQFISHQFQQFLVKWTVSHEKTVPYCPRQNPVERLHQTLKRHMRKSGESSPTKALQVALRAVRSSVNAVTGRAPGDVFLRGGYSTPLRSLPPNQDNLDQLSDDDLHDDIQSRDAVAKAVAKQHYDSHHHVAEKVVSAGDTVFVKQPSGATDKAHVECATAHDVVVATDAGTQRRHLDRVLPTPATNPTDDQLQLDEKSSSAAIEANPSAGPSSNESPDVSSSKKQPRAKTKQTQPAEVRRSSRPHKPKDLPDV